MSQYCRQCGKISDSYTDTCVACAGENERVEAIQSGQASTNQILGAILKELQKLNEPKPQ